MKQGRAQNFDREFENLLLPFQGRSACFCLSFGSAIHSFCPFSGRLLCGVLALLHLEGPSTTESLETPRAWFRLVQREAGREGSIVSIAIALETTAKFRAAFLDFALCRPLAQSGFLQTSSNHSELFLCCCAGTTCAAAPRLRCTAPQHRRCNFSFLGAGLGIISPADTVDSGVVAPSLALLAGTAPSSIFWLSAPRIRC